MDGNASPEGTAGLIRNGHTSHNALYITAGALVTSALLVFQIGPRFNHGSTGDSVSLQSPAREPQSMDGTGGGGTRLRPAAPATDPVVSTEDRADQAGMKGLALWLLDAAGRTHAHAFVADVLAKDRDLLVPQVASVFKDSRLLLDPDGDDWRRGDWGSGSDESVALVVALSRKQDAQGRWIVTVVRSSSAVDQPELLSEAELLARVPWYSRGIPFDSTPPKSPVVLNSGNGS